MTTITVDKGTFTPVTLNIKIIFSTPEELMDFRKEFSKNDGILNEDPEYGDPTPQYCSNLQTMYNDLQELAQQI